MVDRIKTRVIIKERKTMGPSDNDDDFSERPIEEEDYPYEDDEAFS
jgi:hypothetical protein